MSQTVDQARIEELRSELREHNDRSTSWTNRLAELGYDLLAQAGSGGRT